MDWLQDIISKKDVEERNAAKERELANKRLLAEVSKVTPMVRRLLHDLGRAYFGTHWLSPLRETFVIEKRDCSTWRLSRPCIGGYFQVCLEMCTPPRFGIVSAADFGNYMYTNDTSEGELKRLLRLAAEQGTYMDPK